MVLFAVIKLVLLFWDEGSIYFLQCKTKTTNLRGGGDTKRQIDTQKTTMSGKYKHTETENVNLHFYTATTNYTNHSFI
jgi:hypothetical protein